jgi:5-oxoprolinase (ATP-hydrolysing)
LSALVMARGGRLDEAALEAAFLGARWPARRYAENRGDLLAQLAANQAGVRRVEALLADRGAGVVQAAMRAVRDSAARRVRDALAVLPPGRRTFADALDDGTPIVVTVERRGDRLAIDFTGSGAEHPGNLNAPRAVTVAAVIYALRTLVRAPIPLNQGCLDPVDLTIPPRSVLDPSPGCAVAAGNVETSQRVVDVLLGALGVAAASQGTMNNLSFGDARYGYYETIAGGAGATARAAGASAVHTHMTNTRITDAELLEARFPVRLHRFAIRRGSGGRGAHAGGDGVVRELEALAPLTGAIISERRLTRPFGLAGGEPGRSGVNLPDGHTLDGRAAFTWPVGARLVLETPGGGGFGAP